MRLTPSAAARLYGIHRATLYRHMAAGRLSWVLEPDNSRALDLSELIRCYGEPPGHATASATPATPPPGGDATSATERLLAELVELSRQQGEELRRLREEVATLRRLPSPDNNSWSSLHDHPKADDDFLQERPAVIADEGRDRGKPDDDPHGLRAMAREMFKGSNNDH